MKEERKVEQLKCPQHYHSFCYYYHYYFYYYYYYYYYCCYYLLVFQNVSWSVVSLFPRTCSYYYCCYKYYYFGFLLKNPSIKLSCGHWVSSMASLHRGCLSGSNNLKNRVASKDKNNFFMALKSKQYTILCPSAMVKAIMESILIKSLTWSQIWQTLLWPVC